MPSIGRTDIVVLDPTKVRAARLARGIGETALAAALGVGGSVIDRLEHAADQRYLTMVFVHDLAVALGCAIADLLMDSPTAVPGPDASDDPDRISRDDVAIIGSVLATDGDYIAIDTLASALEWTLERTLVALDRLEAELGAVGQTMARLNDSHVALAPAKPRLTAPKLTRRSIAVGGLTDQEARILYRIAENGPLIRYGDLPRTAISRLSAAGLLGLTVGDDRGKPGRDRNAEGARLTKEARYNLVL